MTEDHFVSVFGIDPVIILFISEARAAVEDTLIHQMTSFTSDM